MTKEGFTKLTGLKPTDEEFEIINGLCTVLTEASRAFHGSMTKEYLEGMAKELGEGAVEPISEGDFCVMYGKGEDRKFVFMIEYIYIHLMVLSTHRSDDFFESLQRELFVAQRMLERDYKLSLDDRRLLLEKAKTAAKNITKKD